MIKTCKCLLKSQYYVTLFSEEKKLTAMKINLNDTS